MGGTEDFYSLLSAWHHIPDKWLEAKLAEQGLDSNVRDMITAEVRRRADLADQQGKWSRGGGKSIMRPLAKKITDSLTLKQVLELPEADIAVATLEAKMFGLKSQQRPDQTTVPVVEQPQVVVVEHDRVHRQARRSDGSTTTVYRALKPHEFRANGFITHAAVRKSRCHVSLTTKIATGHGAELRFGHPEGSNVLDL